MNVARGVLSCLIATLGVAMIVLALARGGGALAQGVIIGALFVAAGAGRLWLGRSMR